jgi:hypothetical protein
MIDLEDYMVISIGDEDQLSMDIEISDMYLFGEYDIDNTYKTQYITEKKNIQTELLYKLSPIYNEYDAIKYKEFIYFVVDSLYEVEDIHTLHSLYDLIYPLLLELEHHNVEDLKEILPNDDPEDDVLNNIIKEFAKNNNFYDIYIPLLYISVGLYIEYLEAYNIDQKVYSEYRDESEISASEEEDERLGTDQFRYDPDQERDIGFSDEGIELDNKLGDMNSTENSSETNENEESNNDQESENNNEYDYEEHTDLDTITLSEDDKEEYIRNNMYTLMNRYDRELKTHEDYHNFVFDISETICDVPEGEGSYTLKNIQEDLDKYLKIDVMSNQRIKNTLNNYPKIYAAIYKFYLDITIEDIIEQDGEPEH